MADQALTPEAEKQLASMMMGLTKSEKHGKVAKKMLSEEFGMRFPDIEKEEIDTQLNSFKENFKQEQKIEEVKRQTAAARQSLVDSGRFNEEEIGKLEKMMEEKGISNYEDAAIIYNSQLRPAEPTPVIKSNTWEFPSLKPEDVGNMTQRARETAGKVINEFRNRKAS